MSFTIAGMLTLIAARMKDREFSDAGLAREVGCERSMITKIKLGKATASLPLALKLSSQLDLPPSEFVAKPLPKPKRKSTPQTASAA